MTQIILELPNHFNNKLQIQAQTRQKDVKEIIIDAIGKYIDADDKKKMSFDVTQNPIYHSGSDSEQPKAKTLADLLTGYTGKIDSSEIVKGGAQMSKNAGKKFSEILIERRKQGRL